MLIHTPIKSGLSWSMRGRAWFSVGGVGLGDAPAFVEVGEAGIAVDHVMRRQFAVQRSW
jgi:hypothetical protein